MTANEPLERYECPCCARTFQQRAAGGLVRCASCHTPLPFVAPPDNKPLVRPFGIEAASVPALVQQHFMREQQQTEAVAAALTLEIRPVFLATYVYQGDFTLRCGNVVGLSKGPLNEQLLPWSSGAEASNLFGSQHFLVVAYAGSRLPKEVWPVLGQIMGADDLSFTRDHTPADVETETFAVDEDGAFARSGSSTLHHLLGTALAVRTGRKDLSERHWQAEIEREALPLLLPAYAVSYDWKGRRQERWFSGIDGRPLVPWGSEQGFGQLLARAHSRAFHPFYAALVAMPLAGLLTGQGYFGAFNVYFWLLVLATMVGGIVRMSHLNRFMKLRKAAAEPGATPAAKAAALPDAALAGVTPWSDPLRERPWLVRLATVTLFCLMALATLLMLNPLSSDKPVYRDGVLMAAPDEVVVVDGEPRQAATLGSDKADPTEAVQAGSGVLQTDGF